jgi:putative membrane protein
MADKVETVYVKADACGNTEEMTVEDVLLNTEADLPVSVKISYYLDGQEIAPEKLAGKSGKIRILFEYENQTSETVTVDEKEMNVQIPFAVCSMMFLPSDKFSDIEVTNGKVIDMEDTSIMIGYALPGLTESLKLSDYEPTKDMNFPDHVELTANVIDFELDFTATIVTTGLFDDMDVDKLDDVQDLIDDMGELTKASTELVDGTSQLLDGATEFQDYLSQYIEGVDAVGTGIQSMNDGLSAFNEQSTALSTGAAMLQSGLTSLNDSLPDNWLAELQQIQQAAQTTQNVKSIASEVHSELTQIDLDAVEISATEQSRT